MAIREVIDTDADDGSVLDPPPAEEEEGEEGEGEAQPHAGPAAATPRGASPGRRGGRPKGSRNRTTVEREKASAGEAGFGAVPTSRPAGKTGAFPEGDQQHLPKDADLMWMVVLEEIQAEGFTPYDMEIRVDRQTPLPSGPVGTIEASAVQGDATMSPATALRNYITDWIYLPSGLSGPALYTLHFCWRNSAKFYRRGEMRLQSRNEILAMKQAEQARQAQGTGVGYAPPQPQQPRAQQQPQQQQPQQHQPQPQPYYGGFGASVAPQAPQPSFDPDLERARIRQEIERDFEMRELRRELDDLRRRPQQAPPQYGPGYGNGYPPPQQQRRGVGAPQQQPYYPPQESEDERTARVVMAVLQQAGVIPPRGAQAPVGVGSPAITSTVAQAAGLGDDFERAMDTVTRGKKVFKKMKELFEDDEDAEAPKAKKTGAGATPAEGADEEAPKIRFQGTGQRWKDGREVMMPIDQEGDPIFPTTMSSAMMTGFANPFLLEPLAQGVGAIMSRMAAMTAGLGGQPQQPQRADIGVQQMQQQEVLPPQQFAPPPTPYSPPSPQAPPAAPAEGGGDWNLT